MVSNAIFSDVRGKRLLILGASSDECHIIQAAKEMGVYTITTDYYDRETSPGKKLSDEAWDISWKDIQRLKEMAISRKVDGVIAGYSEFKLKCAIQLCKELNLPFYIPDEELLRITRDKLLFKSECRKYGLPVAKDYYVTAEMREEDLDQIQYPVIVKPADNGGSNGIRFCRDRSEIVSCIKYALSYSESSRVVVEEVLSGHEVVAYYTAADGEIAFSSMFDKYARIEREGFNALMDAYVYPANRLDYYLEHYNSLVVNFLEKIGIRNGVVGIQGFRKPDGSIVFFELGFRLGGTNDYHYTDYFNSVSKMKMLISYSLTGNMHKEELKKEDPSFGGKHGCTFSLVSRDGIIGHQSGLDEVASMNNVLYANYYHKVGDKITNTGSQASKTFRAYIVGDSFDEIHDAIRKIQRIVKVLDTNGNNMLLDDFDPTLINKDY